MASLHSPLTLAAAAHGNIKATHDGLPDNILLILRFAAFRLHSAAMRAVLREWNLDPFIHACRDRAARLPSVAAAWFCGPAPSGWLLGCPANEARPDACWHATLLPVPGVSAQFPVSDGHFLCVAGLFPAAPNPVRVSEQTRCSQAVCRQLAGQSGEPDFRGPSGW
jgi:hypothetical protein